MAKTNTGDFNSAIMLGGVSLVVVGGLIYWYMSKSEIEDKEDSIHTVHTETIHETSKLIEVIF